MLRSLGIGFLKVVGYGATTIVGLFTILWFIGWVRSRNGPQVPGFEGFGPEDEEERVGKC